MDKKNKYQNTSLSDKKKILAESDIIIAAVILLCYFFGFSYIWNTDVGAEVGVNGWNYIFACLSQSFKKTGAVYGDIAVPFYYYAEYYTVVLSIMVTVSLGVLIVFLVFSGINIAKYNRRVSIISAILLYVLAVTFLACIITALTMNGSRILPKYCSSNPKCSIATLAFFPFFISLGSAIIYTIYVHKFEQEEETVSVED